MNDTFLSILKECGISEEEYLVLHAVETHGQLTPEKLPDHAIFLSCCNADAPALVCYQAAMDSCFARGWLKILNADDCERDRLRWISEPNQYCGEWKYLVGNVNFTQEGAHLYDELSAEWYQSENLLPHQGTLGYAWRVPGYARLFGAYEEDVQDNLAKLESGEDFLGPDTLKIDHIGKPYPIGAWWINRFIRLPQGYSATIYYTDEASEEED